MMDSLKNISTQGGAVLLNESSDYSELIQRRDTAFHAALTKLLNSNGNIETVLQTGEAFGRGLFLERIQQKPPTWSIQTWLHETINQILTPMDAELSVTQITDGEAQSRLIKSPLQQQTTESTAASLFTYGFLRGLFLSAFPKGEVLMNTTEGTNPTNELCFKTHASYKDKFERERVKNSYLITKKL